jgi:hypothetical protein
MIYYIYEVKGIKNGCTVEWEKRSKQNFKKYNIMPVVVETYEYPNTPDYWQIVGDREWQLAELNGYPKGVHYRVAMERRVIGGKIGGPIGGKLSGKIASQSGQLKSICSLGGKIGGKISGPIVGRMNVESGQIDIARRKSIEVIRKAIIQLDMDGTFIREWISISEAARELNLHGTSISQVCKGGSQKTTGGFIFRYKEQTHC